MVRHARVPGASDGASAAFPSESTAISSKYGSNATAEPAAIAAAFTATAVPAAETTTLPTALSPA